MGTMTKDDLFHKPVLGEAESWSHKRRESEKLDLQVQQFLAGGGSITQVEQPTVADIKLTYNNKPISEDLQGKANKASQHAQLNKDTARESGRKTFIGMRCKKCGDKFERWVENSACTTCNPIDPSMSPKTLARKALSAAMRKGEEAYCGSQCKVCGTSRRTVANSECIQCKGPDRLRIRHTAESSET